MTTILQAVDPAFEPLLRCLLGASAVWAAALVAAMLLDRRPAAAHRLLVVATLCALLLPVAAFLSPPVRIGPGIRRETEKKIVNHVAESVRAERVSLPQPATVPTIAQSSAPPLPDVVAPSPLPNLSQMIFVAWIVPAVLLLLRLVVAALGVCRAIRRCTAISDEETLAVAAEVAAEMGLRYRIDLRECCSFTAPSCAGLLRPAILLPPEFREWSRLRLRTVLTHEASHLARRDVPTTILASIVAAIYWFHPLAWISRDWMRKLREAACDHLVLQAGAAPCEYARLLLEHAAARSAGPVAAMSQAVGLERRLRRILAFEPGRPEETRLERRALTSVALLFCIAAAVLSPLPRATSASSLASAVESPDEPAVPATDVSGIVVDDSDRPVPGVQVVAWLGEKPTRWTTDDRGRFHFPRPAAAGRGSWKFEAFDKDAGRLGAAFSDLRVKGDLLKIRLKPSRVVLVVVTDDKGAPVPKATVFVNGKPPWQPMVETDQLGRAEIRTIAEEPLQTVFAMKPGVGFDFRTFASPDTTDLRPIHLPQTWSEPVEMVLAGVRPMKVHVADASGEPIRNALVHPMSFRTARRGVAEAFLHEPDGAVVRTDADGLAEFNVLPKDVLGPVQFRIEAPDFDCSGQWKWQPAGSDRLDVRLERRVKVAGRVVDEQGRPAVDAIVEMDAMPFSEKSGHCFGSRKTDPDGRFHFNAYPNKYLIFAAFKERTASNPAYVVVRSESPAEETTLVLRKCVRVFGRVTDEKGTQAKQDARLSLCIQAPRYITLPEKQRILAESPDFAPNLWREAFSANDGSYEFWVAPGSYYINCPNSSGTAFFDVGAAPVERNFRVKSPRSIRLTGSVVRKGDPEFKVAGASIDVEPVGDRDVYAASWAPDTHADASGSFSGVRSPVESLIEARSADGSLAGMQLIHAEQTEVILAVEPVAACRGRLVDSNRAPIAKRKVSCTALFTDSSWRYKRNGHFSAECVTDDDGRFELKGLVVGKRYHVSADLPKQDGQPQASMNLKIVVLDSSGVFDKGDFILKPAR